MRLVRIHRPGGYGRLLLEDHPDPTPGPGEVLVRTRAIGVNFADCVVRMGLYKSAREYVGRPITPGFDFAGEVAGLGDGTRGFELGDRVFGVTRFGAYSSHVVVPTAQLFAIPETLTMEQAGAFPTIHLTAWYALHRLGALGVGDTILVHSAAGGVGGALVQVGKRAGARVIGVVGAGHKVDLVRQHGADVVIDKSKEDLWTAVDAAAPEGFRLVLDANGVATLKEGYRRLAPEGRLITYGAHTMFSRGGSGFPNPLRLAWAWLRTPRFDPLALTSDNRSVMGFNLSFLFDRTDVLHEAMAELTRALADGAVTPPPVRTFALDDVAEAHRAIETGSTVGKLVLLPPEGPPLSAG